MREIKRGRERKKNLRKRSREIQKEGLIVRGRDGHIKNERQEQEEYNTCIM